MMQDAEWLADGLYWIGVLTGLGGLGAGVFVAAKRLFSGEGLPPIADV
jgi:hypothetical protein